MLRNFRDLANNHKVKLGSVELGILFSELSEKVREQTAKSPREMRAIREGKGE